MALEIPENVRLPEKLQISQVTLDPRRTAVIVVDMQNDFIKPSGKLYAHGSEKIIEPIRSVLEKARRSEATIIYTMDWHEKDDPEFEVWGEHALANTWGAEVVDELKPLGDEILVRKPSYDAFYGTSLDHILRTRGLKTLIMMGVIANICVLHTAGSAAMRGYELVVPVDCIFALNEFDYTLALRQMSFIYKARLTSSGMLSFG